MRVTIAILPNGKAIVTLPADSTPANVHQAREQWDRWIKTDEAQALFVPGAEVHLVREVELDSPSMPDTL